MKTHNSKELGAVRTYIIYTSVYLNAQVVVTASGLCSGMHFSQRQHSDIRQNNKQSQKQMLSHPRVRIQRAVHSEINRSHGSPPLLLPRSLCCRVGSWSGLKSRQSVREAVHRLARHPPSLCSKLPPPCCRSLLQLNKCTVVQLQLHHQGKKKKKKHYLTCTAQLPHTHPPYPPALKTAGVSL